MLRWISDFYRAIRRLRTIEAAEVPPLGVNVEFSHAHALTKKFQFAFVAMVFAPVLLFVI